ncbi:TPA: hypothetical protein I9080_003155 [Clostridium perfringens]|uniref:Uncharacterized protein n=1 Tax=Clostridium perfringens TaxID=1502 RepID=A0A8H9UYA3_CLOPF|nr:hypothetical protein [Clostridium perfringens]
MSLQDDLLKKINRVRVIKREISIPAKYRSIYRIAQIALILNINGRSNTCSLKKINIIISAIDDDKQENDLLNFLDSKLNNPLIVRYDPAINRALTLAYAEGIVSVNKNGAFKLTDKGITLVNEIKEGNQYFIEDILKLNRIGKRLSENIIAESIKNRGI